MEKRAFGEALRRAREGRTPADLGLAPGPRRRVPGLRREELAVASGVSADYLARLEQGRGPTPSRQVLTALSQALRLDRDERAELFLLAGEAPPSAHHVDMLVRPSLLRLLDRLADLPAIVVSGKGDVLAWTELSLRLHGPWPAIPPARRNLYLLTFLPHPDDPAMTPVDATDPDDTDTGTQAVAALRSAAARYPRDPEVAALVARLRAESPLFAELWDGVRPSLWRNHDKVLRHPQVGAVRVACDTLHVPDTDQAVVVYSAAPGSRAADQLALLRSLPATADAAGVATPHRARA